MRSPCAPERIDPFALQLHPSEFYRLPDNDSAACLYFIIDNTLPILLYVGETKRTPSQRWKGVHNAKGYVSSYINLHRKYKLDVVVVAAFGVAQSQNDRVAQRRVSRQPPAEGEAKRGASDSVSAAKREAR